MGQSPAERRNIGKVKNSWVTGCCGWSEAQARYFAHFPVIEIQRTFYEPPSPALASKWRALAPPGFQFSIKAWQLITHTPASPTYRRLQTAVSPGERDLFGSFRPTAQVWLAWERTREIARILRASAIVFQCPASFRPNRENIENLSSFFAKVDREGFYLAWEPRGDWPPALIRDICAERNLIHCVDPFKNESVYGDALYWRLHGRDGYSYRYTDDDLDELQRKLRQQQVRDERPAYVLFNNMRMKDDAARFQAKMSQDR